MNSETVFAKQLLSQPNRQLVGQSSVADQEPVFQERRADRVVVLPESDAVGDVPRCMSHFQMQVPEHVEHALDQAFGPGRDFPRHEEQKVHVRAGRHLATAVAADRENRDAFAIRRIGVGVKPKRRDLKCAFDHSVGQVPKCKRRVAGCERTCVQCFNDRGTPAVDSLSQTLGYPASRHGAVPGRQAIHVVRNCGQHGRAVKDLTRAQAQIRKGRTVEFLRGLRSPRCQSLLGRGQ